MSLDIFPISLDKANEMVAYWHRHHKPVQQSKFCIGVAKNGVCCGAAIVGRPVARLLDDGNTLEVNRCVTDGTKNACSCLYGAVARAAKSLGYNRVFTYTRNDEEGASLRGAGWILDDGNIRARSWNMPGRHRTDKTEIVQRQRWLYQCNNANVQCISFPQLGPQISMQMDMMLAEQENGK